MRFFSILYSPLRSLRRGHVDRRLSRRARLSRRQAQAGPPGLGRLVGLSPWRRWGREEGRRPEERPRADGSLREAAQHPQDVLLGEPEPGCPDEGAAGGDDRSLAARHPRLVPEQALQGQEDTEQDDGEADAA